MTVNALRKSNNAEEETVTLAKSLIKSWKKLVPEANDKKSGKERDSKSSIFSARIFRRRGAVEMSGPLT